MLENIFELLKIVKEKKISGKYTAIALGQNKLPESIREAYSLFKKELWER
jgi:hypothetical protein|tara:strand:- start:6118 stop:6267 length:150 start_codon:yes stop_codon:yes gene_type:complete